GGSGGKRDLLEVDREAAARARGDVTGVHCEPVGDVDQGVRDRGETAAVLQAQRRAGVAALAEGGAGSTQWARDDEEVAGLPAAPPGDAVRAADRRDRDREALGPRRVAADDRGSGLVQALVALDH